MLSVSSQAAGLTGAGHNPPNGAGAAGESSWLLKGRGLEEGGILREKDLDNFGEKAL